MFNTQLFQQPAQSSLKQWPDLTISDFEESVTQDMIYNHFCKYGLITSIIFNKSKKISFISYNSKEEAKKAMSESNHSQLLKKKITVMPYIKNFKDQKQKLNESNLVVKNLTLDTNEKDLESTFKQFGEILSTKIVFEEDGKSKGFGYVQFSKVEDIQKALNKQINIKGNNVELEQFVTISDRPKKLANNLYVKNLPSNSDFSPNQVKEKLLERFGDFGKIMSCLVKESKGSYFAFVCFEGDSENDGSISANKAMESLQDQDFFGIGKGIDIYVFEKKIERIKKIKETNLYSKNIREDASDELIKECFEIFGKIVRFTSKKPENNNENFKTKFVLMQFETKEIANTVISTSKNYDKIRELYINPNEIFICRVLSKQEIFDVRKAKKSAKMYNQQLFQSNIPQQYPNTGAPTIGAYGNFPNQMMMAQQFMNQQMPFYVSQQNMYPQNMMPMMPPNMMPNPNMMQNIMPNNMPNMMVNNVFAMQKNNNNSMNPGLAGQGGQQRNYQNQNNNRSRPHNMNNMQGAGRGYPHNQPSQNQNQMRSMPPNNMYPSQINPMMNRPLPKEPSPPREIREIVFDPNYIQNHIEEFKAMDTNKQRAQLGEIMFPKISKTLAIKGNNDIIAKITGMLIDLDVFEVQDVLDMARDENILREKIQEAIDMLNDGQ